VRRSTRLQSKTPRTWRRKKNTENKYEWWLENRSTVI
jgi:hypothetical protein